MIRSINYLALFLSLSLYSGNDQNSWLLIKRGLFAKNSLALTNNFIVLSSRKNNRLYLYSRYNFDKFFIDLNFFKIEVNELYPSFEHNSFWINDTNVMTDGKGITKVTKLDIYKSNIFSSKLYDFSNFICFHYKTYDAEWLRSDIIPFEISAVILCKEKSGDNSFEWKYNFKLLESDYTEITRPLAIYHELIPITFPSPYINDIFCSHNYCAIATSLGIGIYDFEKAQWLHFYTSEHWRTAQISQKATVAFGITRDNTRPFLINGNINFPDNNPVSVIIDNNQCIYLGFNDGLFYYDQKYWHKISNNKVDFLRMNSQGIFAINNRDIIIYKDKNEIKRIAIPKGINKIRNIDLDDKGILVLTEIGIYYYDLVKGQGIKNN